MPRETVVKIDSDAGIVDARQRGRALALELGFSGSDQAIVATAISELARNIVEYARQGQISLSAVRDGGRQGIIVVAHDDGPGIADIARAMEDGYSGGNGLGLGLPGAKRLMDDFEIESELGKGTTITMRKWAR